MDNSLNANRDANREKTDVIAVSPLNGAKLTRADARLAGKKKSERKTIANRLKGRKYCNKGCVLWECPYASLSLSDQFNGKCALKCLPYSVQKRIIRLYIKGERGVIEELREILARIAEKVSIGEDPQPLRGYYRDIQDYIKIVYGEKKRLAGTIEHEHRLRTADIVRIIKRSRNEPTS